MENNIRITNFEDMKLKENLLRGIYAYGFEKPSEIQARAIVPVCLGNDIIAQSQSGTGKTGTFTISTLERVDESVIGPQAIIVAPTRELAIQIHDVCGHLGQYTKIKPVLCVGKCSIHQSKEELESNASIVIGTPGRIIDMIERRFLSTRLIRLLVLDEADEMLSDGFKNQIKKIVVEIPTNAQICLFSATMPVEVLDLAHDFMNNPQRILVKREELTLEGIRQFYINIQRENWKLDTFCDIYDLISVSQTIVYTNTKKKAEWLRKQLEDRKFTVSIIHSDMGPLDRTKIMKEFRNGKSRILISTDLLSRGIDIQQVSIVINYDLPFKPDCYLHRIGRSGRFGRKGIAINLITDRDYRYVRDLQAYFCTQIEELPENFQDYIN